MRVEEDERRRRLPGAIRKALRATLEGEDQ
jgi:hypothetical protein